MTSVTVVAACAWSDRIGRVVITPARTSGSPTIEKSGRIEIPRPAATIALPISAPSVAYVVRGSAAPNTRWA